MKISQNPSPSRPAAGGATGPGRASASTRPAHSHSPAPSAPVDAAARLSQLESQFSHADFNAAKVSEISAAITAGRYKVDSSAVADKLLSSAASLARAKN